MSGGLYSTEAKDFGRILDLSQAKPYGDIIDDGKVQLSFTLPVPKGAEVEEAAKFLLKEMGLQNPMVVFSEELTKGFTFFSRYGSCTHTIDYSNIHVPKVELTTRGMEEIDELIRTHIGRKLVALGVSIGTDAYTVGIDAIMNMKGFADHYGLEHCDMINAYNLGSRVPNEEFIAKSIGMNADALPVSQIVTQKDVHTKNMTEFIEFAEAEGSRDKMITICGGPRTLHELAKEPGFDAGLGANTFADDVASFIYQEIVCHKEVAEGKWYSACHN